MARDRMWDRFKRALRRPSELEDEERRSYDRRGLIGGHDARSHSKGGPGELESRDYGAFVDHRPPWLGPSRDSNLMRGASLERPTARRVLRQPPPREGAPAFRASRSDHRILEDVCDAMTDEGWLDPSEIEVTVDRQRVTLLGSVESREQKWLAEECAEHVLGVLAVVNRIRVRRPGAPADARPENGHDDGRHVS